MIPGNILLVKETETNVFLNRFIWMVKGGKLIFLVNMFSLESRRKRKVIWFFFSIVSNDMASITCCFMYFS